MMRSRSVLSSVLAASLAMVISVATTTAQSPVPDRVVGAGAPFGAPADAEVVEQFPVTVDGQSLEVRTWDGPAWIARHEDEGIDDPTTIGRTEILLESLDRTLDDLHISAALHERVPGDVSTITTVTIDGVPAHDTVDAVLALMAPGILQPEALPRIVAERHVLRVIDRSMPGAYPLTLLLVDDKTWLIRADRPLLDEIVWALPRPSLVTGPAWVPGDRTEVPELGLSLAFPTEWEIEIDTWWERYSAQAELFGPGVDDWSGLRGIGPYLSESDLRDDCMVRIYRPLEMSAPEFFDLITAGVLDPPKVTLDTDELVVFSGPAGVENWEAHMGVSIASGAGAVVMLLCMSDHPPEDDWRSIAETIELTPMDPSQIGVGLERSQQPDPTSIAE